jgi:hypothetical protein
MPTNLPTYPLTYPPPYLPANLYTHLFIYLAYFPSHLTDLPINLLALSTNLPTNPKPSLATSLVYLMYLIQITY